jgi:hypothetical protein
MTGKIYIGLVGIGNTGASVTSAAYDCFLDSSNTSVTIGLGETKGDSADPSRVWLDSSVNGEGVSYLLESI